MQHHSPRCASVPQQQQSASVRYQHTARVSLRPQKCRQPPFSSHAAAFTRLSHHTCSANRPSTGLTTPKKSRQTITCALPPEHDVAAAQKKLAVFVSGGGSNFKAIHSACLAGHINATVAVSWCGLHPTEATPATSSARKQHQAVEQSRNDCLPT